MTVLPMLVHVYYNLLTHSKYEILYFRPRSHSIYSNT